VTLFDNDISNLMLFNPIEDQFKLNFREIWFIDLFVSIPKIAICKCCVRSAIQFSYLNVSYNYSLRFKLCEQLFCGLLSQDRVFQVKLLINTGSVCFSAWWLAYFPCFPLTLVIISCSSQFKGWQNSFLSNIRKQLYIM